MKTFQLVLLIVAVVFAMDIGQAHCGQIERAGGRGLDPDDRAASLDGLTGNIKGLLKGVGRGLDPDDRAAGLDGLTGNIKGLLKGVGRVGVTRVGARGSNPE